MFKVVKRDGEVADFDLQKIGCAIEKAFDATQMQYNKDMVDLLNLRVTADFQKKIKDDKIDVESIQDSVENVLVQAGYADVAKAYILYRKQREKIRNMKSTILDYKEIVDSYVKVEDWRVKENSTVTYCFQRFLYFFQTHVIPPFFQDPDAVLRSPRSLFFFSILLQSRSDEHSV